MNSSYQLDSLKGQSGCDDSSIEVCAKLINCKETRETIHSLVRPTTTLFIQGDLKGYDDPRVGYDPASNFRDGDRDTNNSVIRNWMNLFEVHQRVRGRDVGIVCTSIPRADRYLTINMDDDGVMRVMTGPESIESRSTSILNSFLHFTGITRTRVLKMREASKGSRYRTYFADLQAFIISMNFKYHPEMFDTVFMTPTLISPGDLETLPDGTQLPILREKKLPGDKIWKPKDMDYLYFLKSAATVKKHCPHSQNFHIPKTGTVSKVYYQIDQLLSNEDNGLKKMVREYFLNLDEWHRWSDYWVNDVDDAITIFAIIHAFKFCDLTETESITRARLELIAKPWYEQFATNELLNIESEPEPEY